MQGDTKERISKYLKELVAIDSVSCTKEEYRAGDWFKDFFESIPYFKKHPELTGQYVIPGDAFGRTVPWALLLGKSKNTIVSSGHYDVVGTECYGELSEKCYEIGDDLHKALATKDMAEEARKDLESGEWIWGRGAADMKGGHAIHLALFEEYAEMADAGTLPGCLLYLPVPDEESYSVGMREGAKIILDLKKKYDLDFKLLVDPEPSDVNGESQVMSLGTVGKMMPVVMVQGVSAHVGHCFNGINPIGILSGIYKKTNISLDFSDSFDGESTVPPTWTKFRDMKELYDVTIPLRACGYFTILWFSTTPEEAMAKLKTISKSVLDESVAELDSVYQEYKKTNKFAELESIKYNCKVYSFEELVAELKERDAAGFEAFYNDAYKEIGDMITDGAINYPDATIKMMGKVMDFADLKQPTVLLGFAPPYYPAVNSDLIPGKENAATRAYEVVKKASESMFGQKLTYEHYFMGISDGSYCAIDHPFDYEKFSKNTPMYGDLYSLDFEAIGNINIPMVLYGPISKQYHQWTERVNKKSLFETVPGVTRELFEYLWSL